jgi:predicted Zn-dependent peptidase
MGRDSLYQYVQRCYTPSRLVVSAAGNVSHDALVEMAEQALCGLPADQAVPTVQAAYSGGEHRMDRPLEQSHIVLGFKSIGRHDPRYYSAVALANILGGGMSSRLFQEVREKRGLVYSVFSFHSAYDDDGQFAIYAGTGPERLQELVPVVCDEIKKITQSAVTAAELARVKTQMRSNLLMARESMMTRASQQAKHMIHFNHVLDLDTILSDIDAVNMDTIQTLAGYIFSSRPTLAELGPLKNLESYDQVCHRLAA